jgi:hypothetical protein
MFVNEVKCDGEVMEKLKKNPSLQTKNNKILKNGHGEKNI